MKKLILALIITSFLVSSAYAEARNIDRQISSGQKTSSQIIKSTSGQLFGINIIATSSPGYVIVYDSSNSTTSGKTILTEIGEATSGNSQVVTFPGINAVNGIYVESSGVSYIIYYY